MCIYCFYCCGSHLKQTQEERGWLTRSLRSPDSQPPAKTLPLVLRHGELEHNQEGHHTGGARVAGLVMLGRLLGVDRHEDLVELLEQIGRRFLVESHLS